MELSKTLELRIKARRQILFSREDPCIQAIALMLDGCSRKVTVSWALDLAEETVLLLKEKYPEDHRASDALLLTRQWARGEIKMPIAKRAILDCHAAAKEITDAEDIAHYHAVGQACGTVHANAHAIGYPIYDLTALVRKYGTQQLQTYIDRRIDHYAARLSYWETACQTSAEKWAAFLE